MLASQLDFETVFLPGMDDASGCSHTCSQQHTPKKARLEISQERQADREAATLKDTWMQAAWVQEMPLRQYHKDLLAKHSGAICSRALSNFEEAYKAEQSKQLRLQKRDQLSLMSDCYQSQGDGRIWVS